MDKFAKLLENYDEKEWMTIVERDSVTQMVDGLHEVFDKCMRESFEFKTRKKKMSEPFWMADWLRDLIEKRRNLFRNEGRTERWKKFKAKVVRIVRENKDKYFVTLREKYVRNGDPSKFHAYAQTLLSGNEHEQWDVWSLCPEKSDIELAEWLADFFNGFSSEYQPLNHDEIPRTFDIELPIITTEQVKKRILEAKKKTAAVQGDLPAKILIANIDKIVRPVTSCIYNVVTAQKCWPAAWSTEQVIVIPKGRDSDEPAKCRNISCTNFLSKIYESFVLEWARKEVVPT